MLTVLDSGVAFFANGHLLECAYLMRVERTTDRLTFKVRSLKTLEQTPDTLYPFKAGDDVIVQAVLLTSGQRIEVECKCESIAVVDEVGAKNHTYVEAVLTADTQPLPEWRL